MSLLNWMPLWLCLTHARRIIARQELLLILYWYGWHKTGLTENESCLHLLVTQLLNVPFRPHLRTTIRKRSSSPRKKGFKSSPMYVVWIYFPSYLNSTGTKFFKELFFPLYESAPEYVQASGCILLSSFFRMLSFSFDDMPDDVPWFPPFLLSYLLTLMMLDPDRLRFCPDYRLPTDHTGFSLYTAVSVDYFLSHLC